MNSPSSQLEALPVVTSSTQQLAPIEREQNRAQRRLTRKQLHYLFISQAMGGAFVDGILNFVFATAMYRTTRKEIRMWPLEQNTIAGDLGVTIIIMSILSTPISCALVREDVVKKEIEPFSFDFPDVAWWQGMCKSHTGKKWIGAVVSFFSPKQTITFRYGFDHFAKCLGIIIIRGFLISALFFFAFWPIAIAITAPLYDGKNLHGTWTPEIIKALFGATIGFFMTPFIAALVLGSHAASASSSHDIEMMHPNQIHSPTSSSTSHQPKNFTKALSHSHIASMMMVPKSSVASDSSSTLARVASSSTIGLRPAKPDAVDSSTSHVKNASITVDVADSPTPQVKRASTTVDVADLSTSQVKRASTMVDVTDLSKSQVKRASRTVFIPGSQDSASSHGRSASAALSFIPGSQDSASSHSAQNTAPPPITFTASSPVLTETPTSHARRESSLVTTAPPSTDLAR